VGLNFTHVSPVKQGNAARICDPNPKERSVAAGKLLIASSPGRNLMPGAAEGYDAAFGEGSQQ
jgi:hypothetical protein